MRSIQYVSPSSLKTFYTDREEYYLKYLADFKKPRDPQTLPMSVGSAFDAYVKHYLYRRFHGELDPRFAFDALFAAQVEEHNRDFALEAGKVCFEAYKVSGALSDLLTQMMDSPVKPEFEADLRGVVGGASGNVGGVPLFGKPDLFFKTVDGVSVVYDWKVNGYCSQASPKAGYVVLRDGWKGSPSRSAGKCHKDAVVHMRGRIPVNVAQTMDVIEPDWANQTTIYAWMLGEAIGSNFIVGIDQLACAPGQIRVAEHRSYVGKAFQEKLASDLLKMWAIVQSGWIFDSLSREASDARCSELDSLVKSMDGEDLFRKMTS